MDDYSFEVLPQRKPSVEAENVYFCVEIAKNSTDSPWVKIVSQTEIENNKIPLPVEVPFGLFFFSKYLKEVACQFGFLPSDFENLQLVCAKSGFKYFMEKGRFLLPCQSRRYLLLKTTPLASAASAASGRRNSAPSTFIQRFATSRKRTGSADNNDLDPLPSHSSSALESPIIYPPSPTTIPPDSTSREPWPPYTSNDIESVCLVFPDVEKKLVEAVFRVHKSQGGRPRIDEITEVLLGGVNAESFFKREVFP